MADITITGVADFSKVKAEISALGQQTKKTTAEVAAVGRGSGLGVTGVGDAAAGAGAKITDGFGRARREMSAFGKETRRVSEEVKKSSYSSGQSVLEISRAVEDAQYGIRGVLNNIPGIVLSLGGTGGLAGVISLAAVAASIAMPKIKSLFAVSQEEIEKTAAAVAQLNEKISSIGEKRGKAAVAGLVDSFKIEDSAIERAQKLAETANELLTIRNQIAKGAADRKFSLEAAVLGSSGLGEAERRALMADLEKRRARAASDFDLADFSQARDMASQKAKDAYAKVAIEQKRSDELAAMLAEASSAAKLRQSKLNDAQFASSSKIPSVTSEIARLGGLIGAEKASLFPNREALAKGAERLKGLKEELKSLNEAALGGSPQSRSALAEMQARVSALSGELQRQLEIEQQAVKVAGELGGIRDSEAEKARLRTNSARESLRLEIERLDVEKKGADDRQAEAIFDEFFKAKEDRMKQLAEDLKTARINPNDLLSSSGRYGGSGAEFKTAVSVVNFQRETIKVLREIATNTKQSRITAWQ